MAFGIIIKGKESRKGFFPHMNTAIGKYIHTKEDYRAEMKKGGYVPYDSKVEPKKKAYKVSDETRGFVKAIKQQTEKGEFKPSNSLKNELRKRGALKTKEELKQIEKKAREYGALK